MYICFGTKENNKKLYPPILLLKTASYSFLVLRAGYDKNVQALNLHKFVYWPYLGTLLLLGW